MQRVTDTRIVAPWRAIVPPTVRRRGQRLAAAQSWAPTIAESLVENLLKLPGVMDAVHRYGWHQLIEKGKRGGIDFVAESEALRASENWPALIAEVEDTSVEYPEYYTVPFHTYPEGNLSIKAAVEFEVASDVSLLDALDPKKKTYNKETSWVIRRRYAEGLLQKLQAAGYGVDDVRRVLDLGCATGRSVRVLSEYLPHAHVTGLDLSPYFLAVGKAYQKRQEEAENRPSNIAYVHGSIEKNPFEEGTFDLVTSSFLLHELPQEATRDFLKAAWSLLRPGGVLSFVERDPTTVSVATMRILYPIFRSTEPWLMDYLTFPMDDGLKEIGFVDVQWQSVSPLHFYVFAVKPN